MKTATTPLRLTDHCASLKNFLPGPTGSVTGEHPGILVQTAGLRVGDACKIMFACQARDTKPGEGDEIESVVGTFAKEKALENGLLPADMSSFTVSCTTSFAPVDGIGSEQMLKRNELVAGSRSCGPLSL